jgi:hypothetical protein
MLRQHKRKNQTHPSSEDRSRTNRHSNFAANLSVHGKNQGQRALQLRNEKDERWKMHLSKKQSLHHLRCEASDLQILSFRTQNCPRRKAHVSLHN